MDMTRRTVLKGAGATSLLLGLMTAGLLRPTEAYAATWNKAAFEAKEFDAILKGIGADAPATHKDVVVRVQDIAENGATVPVTIVSNIPNTTAIAVVVRKNPLPLSAYFELAEGALPEVAIRLKVAETSIIQAVVKADGKFYTAQKEVKVTTGGCS